MQQQQQQQQQQPSSSSSRFQLSITSVISVISVISGFSGFSGFIIIRRRRRRRIRRLQEASGGGGGGGGGGAVLRRAADFTPQAIIIKQFLGESFEDISINKIIDYLFMVTTPPLPLLSFKLSQYEYSFHATTSTYLMER